MLPSEVPVRTPDQLVDVSWWNTLRTAAVYLENLIGGAIARTVFTIANNTGPSNVTGLLLSSVDTLAANASFHLRRKTSAGKLAAQGVLRLFYRTDDSTWDIQTEIFGDDCGVVFTVTAAGQVQYTSDNMAGTSYVGTLTFKVNDTIDA